MITAVVYNALDAGRAFGAVVNAVGTEAAFRAVFHLGMAGTASLAVFPGGSGAVQALEIVLLAQLGADLAGCPTFTAELNISRAVAAVFAVVAVFKGAPVAHIAGIAPAVFLAGIAQPAVRTEVIVFLTALAAVIAVGAGTCRALKAELAVFAPAAAVFASAALLAECFVILAFAAVRAMRTAIDGTVRADIAAANAQIFLVKAFLAVAAVMLLPAIAIVGIFAAVVAVRADPVIAQMGTAVLAVCLLIPRIGCDGMHGKRSNDHGQYDQDTPYPFLHRLFHVVPPSWLPFFCIFDTDKNILHTPFFFLKKFFIVVLILYFINMVIFPHRTFVHKLKSAVI